jgi:hypothetical protein
MITTLAIKAYLAATGAPGDAVEDPISLDSDEDEPQVVEARLPPDARAHVRDGLYVSRSAAGFGLFSSVAIPAGALLGYFGGNWRTESEYSDLPAAQQRLLDQYSATVQPELDGLQPEPLVVAPPIAAGQQRPNLQRYPLAAANEPPADRRANAAFQRVQLSVDDVSGRVLDDQADGEWVGLVVYACSAIATDQEITVHYGADFPRARYGYQTGEPCELPEETESPLALGRVPLSELGLVNESVSDVSDDSDDSYDGAARGKRPAKRPTRRPKTRRVEGASSSGAGSSSEPLPAPPPAPPLPPQPASSPEPQSGPQLFGGSGGPDVQPKPQLPPEFLRFHNERAVESMKSGSDATMSIVDQAFANMALTSTVQKRHLELDVLRGYDPSDDPDAFLRAYQTLEAEIAEIADPLWREQQERKLRSADPVLLDYLSDQAAGATVVFDLETTKLVDKRVPIEEMTISVATALILQPGSSLEQAKADGLLFEFWHREARRGAPFRFLAHLLGEARTVAAYNGRDFDLRVLSSQLSTTEQAIVGAKLMDPMLEIEQLTGIRLKLSTLLSANSLPPKAGAGASAPGLWENGKFDALALYCAQDTMLLAKLVSLPMIKLPQGGQTANGTLLRHHALPLGDPRGLVQGSNAWLAVRQKYLTASEAGAALGLKGAYSNRSDVYETLFYTLRGQESTIPTQGSANMARGNELEPKARRVYMRTAGVSFTVSTTGLHVHLSAKIAASPDALLGKPEAPTGVLELKVPAAGTKGPGLTSSRLAQVQVQLACTDAQFADYTTLYEYRPGEFELGVIRVDRDDALIAVIVEGLLAFYNEAEQDDEPPQAPAIDPRYNARLMLAIRNCFQEHVNEERRFAA